DLRLVQEGERKADALANFATGLIADDNADSELALQKYRRALELDPSYAELAVKVAFELTRRNDPSAGIQILKDTVKVAPKEAVPYIYLSQLYGKSLKKPDLALRYAEKAAELDPKNVAAHLAVVEVHLSQEKADKAQGALDRALKSGSEDPDFWLQIGEVYTRLKEAKGAGEDSEKDLETVNGIFRKAAELGADRAIVQAKVGNYFVDSQQQKEAIPYYLTAISLKEDTDEPVVLNAREKLARVLLETGKPEEGIAMLEEITKANPLRYATYELLGELYYQKGDYDKALANFQHSVLLDATEPNNHMRVAQMQMQLKRFDEAVETAQAARARFPDHPEALYLLALTLSQAKKHPEAMTAFAEVQAEFETNNEQMLNAGFYFSYGAAAEQAGLYDKAAELLRKCIELDPGQAAEAYNYLGYMWVERDENLDEAGEMIRKAVEAEPENGAFLDSLGWYHFKKGEYQKALEALSRASELIKPEDPVIFDHLADVHHKMGDVAEAVRNWQKALALKPEEKDEKKIAQKLDQANQKVTANRNAPPAQPTPAPVPAP
ncbi:MAG: tetratricopeptide repeat protein, partial [Chthoniobacteraceae bacterium]